MALSFRNMVMGWIAAAVGLAVPSLACATTFLMVTTATGGDDLRGGNTAYITMVLDDGTVIPERALISGSRGAPGGSEDARVRGIRFPETIDPARIRAFRVRHDGNPRAGHPFDTYDNWDLRRLSINVRSLRGAAAATFYSPRDMPGVPLVHRFTGESRQIELPVSRTPLPASLR